MSFRPGASSVRIVVILLLGVTGTLRLDAQSVASSSTQEPNFQPAIRPKFAPDRLLVRFKPQASKADRVQAHERVGGTIRRDYRIVPGLQLITLPEGSRAYDAIREYRRNPGVLYAEPDYIRFAFPQSPNDLRFVNGEQWNLHNTGQLGGVSDADIDAPEAWDVTTGSPSVYVGIIDSGIDVNHPDLTANLAQLESNCSDGMDNDGNGFIDDCRGLNAILSNNNVADDFSHGTHVAGIIGATGNNGIGVSGVNWSVRLIACKFLDANGFGADSDAIECLQYFQDLKINRGVNLVATNNSWGGPGFSQALYDAVQTHLSSGILFVAAAGNAATDNDVQPDVPSSFYLPNVLAAASTTRTDARSDFSNFGRQTVHLGAPGSDIVSTVPPALNGGSSYASFNGTSMAAPHVAGVAALLKAADNSRDWIAIRNLILSGGDDNANLASTVTRKRLNAFGSMSCANRVVQSRLKPVGSSLSATVGSPLALAMLHINCASPNGVGVVTVSPGGATINLLDDGNGTDQVAGDGVYSGQFVPPSLGTFTLSFPGSDSVTVNVVTPYGYSSTAFNYRNIGSTHNLNLSDDASASVTPPFPLLFAGASYNTVHVSSNGALSFDGGFAVASNQPLPYPQAGTLVAPFWDDLFPRPGTLQNVFWEVQGTAPNRELIIEWRDLEHFLTQGSPTVKFQVVFFESNNTILFNYADVFFGGCCLDQAGNATVGVQVASSTATQFSFNQPLLTSGSALLWQTQATPNPVPTATALLPSSADEFDPDFTLTVTGSDFLSASRVRWNGVDRATQFISSTELRTSIATFMISTPGTVPVTVFNPAPGGGESAALNFVINDIPNNPYPNLLSISPLSTDAGGPDLTVTLMGHDFVSNSVARWGTTELATTYVNSDQLTAVVPASLITLGQVGVVSIYTPPPGGGVSAGWVLLVNNPSPSLAMISPTSAPAGGGAFTLSVTGSNFVATSEVQWNAVGLPTVFIDGGHLTTMIPVTQLIAPGSATVDVRNPNPGGGVSASAIFTITDFDLGADPATRTVAPGGAATYTITLTPLGGSYSNAINLTCPSGVPARTTCSFQPSSLTPGTSAAIAILTLATSAQTSAMAVPPRSTTLPLYAAFLAVPALLWIGTVTGIRYRRRRVSYFLTALLLAGIMVHLACGGGGGFSASGGGSSGSPPPTITPGTPPGSYNITVQANSGNLTRTTTVTLVVQ